MRERETQKKLVPTVQMDEWMTPAEVAHVFGVSTSRIRQLSLAGQLPFEQTPLGRIYPRTEIERIWKERQTKKGGKTK
jgi:hypothetical protein